MNLKLSEYNADPNSSRLALLLFFVNWLLSLLLLLLLLYFLYVAIVLFISYNIVIVYVLYMVIGKYCNRPIENTSKETCERWDIH